MKEQEVKDLKSIVTGLVLKVLSEKERDAILTEGIRTIVEMPVADAYNREKYSNFVEKVFKDYAREVIKEIIKDKMKSDPRLDDAINRTIDLAIHKYEEYMEDNAKAMAINMSKSISNAAQKFH